jgi:hypothetical protein
MKNVLMAAVVITMAYGSSVYAAGEARGPNFEVQMAAPSTPDYRFEVTGMSTQTAIGKTQQNDTESVVILRLVRGRDGSAVTNAEVALERVDMAPDGMRDMAARANVRPVAGNPGTYRVEIQPDMAGRWGMAMVARVADQPTPFRQNLTVTLAK